MNSRVTLEPEEVIDFIALLENLFLRTEKKTTFLHNTTSQTGSVASGIRVSTNTWSNPYACGLTIEFGHELNIDEDEPIFFDIEAGDALAVLTWLNDFPQSEAG